MKRVQTVRDFGEKRIIEELITPICGLWGGDTGQIGIGDDAAMLKIPPGMNLLVSTDKIPEDLLALQLGLMDPFEHGRYVATVNVSDIGAMGGKPLGLLLTMALRDDFQIDYLSKFLHGFAEGGTEWDIPVVGGDLGSGTATCFSATAIGCVRGNRVLRRSGARIGDQVFVTGHVGVFNTALIYYIVARPKGLRLSESEEGYLRERLAKPKAKVREGQLLADSGICSSCMDITDGVGRTCFELSEASKLCFLVREVLLPIHETTRKVAEYLRIDAVKIIYGIGLDLELMGTLQCAGDQIPNSLSGNVALIGEVHDGSDNVLIRRNGATDRIEPFGWEHFAGDARDMVLKSLDSLSGP